MLLSLSISFILAYLLPPSLSLVCYSTDCQNPDEHGLCLETCTRPDEACHSTFLITLNHTVELGISSCHRVSPTECLATTCQLDTPTPSLGYCCCRTDRCNTIPGLFGDTTPAPPLDLCGDIECSHSCTISGGVPRCLCPVGMALDIDRLTCTDVNECLDEHHDVCSHICVNTNGSFRCDCPPDSGLRLATDGYTCEPVPGLVCVRHSLNCSSLGTGCNDIDYCDRALAGIRHPPSHEACTATGFFDDNNVFKVSLQLCLIIDESHACSEGGQCVLEPSGTRGSYSCCCRENLCNGYGHLVIPDPDATTPPPPPPKTTEGSTAMDQTTTAITTVAAPQGNDQSHQWTLPVFASVTSIFAILLVVVVIVVIAAFRHTANKRTDDETGDRDDSTDNSGIQLLPRATNFENPPIGSGRFSTVYRQPVQGVDRAVKVFQKKDKASFERELSIYKLRNFKHPNVLLFVDTVVYPEELQMIFEFHENGSLHDLLNKQAISLKQFCDIAVSASRGLAHLHTEVIKDGMLFKACVAHRDLKSKNILIKSDGTACISDFGLAIKWPIEVPNEAHGQVGTARYMAPELLEGSINFDQDAYFRIDVYAFALILWELTTRTNTRNGPVTEYKPPFDDMVPPNPSVEDMRKVVVDRNTRPVFPKVFSNHCDMDDVVNTIQESWDVDCDARLSAQCIYERLSSFSSKLESLSKDSGFAPQHPSSFRFDSVEPHVYTSQYDSSLTSGGGSPTNKMKPALSEASTTFTGGATPTIGSPNAAIPTASQNTNGSGVNVVGPRPSGGGNPVVNYPRPSHNVAPPLHQTPNGYQYRFVQAPSFPCHPPAPPTNHRGNQTLPTTTANGIVSRQSSNPPNLPSSSQARCNGTTPTHVQVANHNQRNSQMQPSPRPLPQSTPPSSSSNQYPMESTV